MPFGELFVAHFVRSEGQFSAIAVVTKGSIPGDKIPSSNINTKISFFVFVIVGEFPVIAKI